MKFKIEHKFDYPVEKVEEIMIHPEVHKFMTDNMDTIISVEPIERVQEGNILKRKAYYKPKPLIEKVGPMKVDPRWMEWIEESEYDLEKHEGKFKNVPKIKRIAEKMDNYGTVRFLRTGENSCTRIIEGELKVKIFMIGKIAEKIIFKNAKKILDEEAEMIKKMLKNQ